MPLSEPSVVEVPEQPTLAVRLEVQADELGAHLGDALSRAMNYALHHAGGSRPPFVRRLKRAGTLLTVDAGVCVSAPVEGEGELVAGSLPKCKAACAIWQGAYESLDEGHRALAAWVKASGLERAGPPWEIHLVGPTDVSDPAATLSKLYQPVR